jgi:hypothetical protein
MAEATQRHMIEIATTNTNADDIILFRIHDDNPTKHTTILSGTNRMIHT